MSIYLMGDQAFVDIGDGYMLCVGSKKEVQEADEKQLVEMIVSAITWSRYRAIGSAKGLVTH